MHDYNRCYRNHSVEFDCMSHHCVQLQSQPDSRDDSHRHRHRYYYTPELPTDRDATIVLRSANAIMYVCIFILLLDSFGLVFKSQFGLHTLVY
jgi:hypothetical protein